VYDSYLEGMHDEDIRGGVHGEQAAGRGQGHFVVCPHTALSLHQGGFGIAVFTQVQHALARSSGYCSAWKEKKRKICIFESASVG